jgi:hypothetical protein
VSVGADRASVCAIVVLAAAARAGWLGRGGLDQLPPALVDPCLQLDALRSSETLTRHGFPIFARCRRGRQPWTRGLRSSVGDAKHVVLEANVLALDNLEVEFALRRRRNAKRCGDF